MKPMTAAAALKDLSDALDAFRVHSSDPSLNHVTVFLAISQRKTISASEIVRATGLSQSAVSRTIIALGRGKSGNDGLGLVLQELNPKNARAHAIRVTAKGRALAEQLARCGERPEKAQAVRNGKGMEPDAGAGEDAFQHVHWQNWMD